MQEALEKANRILDDERGNPTTEYYDPVSEWMISKKPPPPNVLELITKQQGRYSEPRKNLLFEREEKPRTVHEYPDEYLLRSENFDMLVILLGRLAEPDRETFVRAILGRISHEKKYRLIQGKRYSSLGNIVSELPLIAEFCIRTRYTDQMIFAVSNAPRPSVALITMLKEIEEIVILNFTCFSEEELGNLAFRLKPLLDTAQKASEPLEKTYQGVMRSPMPSASHELQEERAMVAEVRACVSRIAEACRKARYFWLKASYSEKARTLK